MRLFHSMLPCLGLVAALSLTAGAPAADEIVPGAKLVGKYTMPMTMDTVLMTTADGPRIAGLDGIFAARRDWGVWDGTTGKVLGKVTSTRPAGLVAAEGIPEVSPDGKRLALIYQWQVSQFTASTNVVEAVVYDVKTRKMVFLDRRRSPIQRTLFTPKGSLLVLDQECRVLEPGKAKFSRSFKIAKVEIAGAAVSPDESRLALYAAGTLYVYDLAAGKLEFELAVGPKPKPKNENDLRVITGADLTTNPIAFSGASERLLLYREESVQEKGAAGKPFGVDFKVTGYVHLIDLKEKKAIKELKLPEKTTCLRAFFAAEDEPRALVAMAPVDDPKQPAPPPKQGPQPKGLRGPKLDTLEVYHAGTLRTFKFVDLSGKSLAEFTLSSPPLLMPQAGQCLLSAEGRYLAAITTTMQAQNKGLSSIALWDLENVK